jgi:hypothetical protein
MNPSTRYAQNDAAKIAGIPVQWLWNWKYRGLLVSSSDARFSFRDLVAIRVLTALKGLGVDLLKCGEVATYIQTVAPLETTFVVWNGDKVTTVEKLSSLFRKKRRSVCLIDLQGIVTELRAEAAAVAA